MQWVSSCLSSQVDGCYSSCDSIAMSNSLAELVRFSALWSENMEKHFGKMHRWGTKSLLTSADTRMITPKWQV